jgi:hypothetical protein
MPRSLHGNKADELVVAALAASAFTLDEQGVVLCAGL